MGGNTGKINKPAKRKRAKRKQYARQEQQGESTTREKLRQSRSNPHANVRLSGKKKRQLLKEARRMVTEQLVVDASAMALAQLQEGACQNEKEKMDTD